MTPPTPAAVKPPVPAPRQGLSAPPASPPDAGQLLEVLGVSKQQSAAPSEDLLDLHWRLGVVASSSEKDEAGKTFVQVNFISQTPGDGRRRNRLVEMSLDKFYNFLHQLEKCKASLEHSRHLPQQPLGIVALILLLLPVHYIALFTPALHCSVRRVKASSIRQCGDQLGEVWSHSSSSLQAGEILAPAAAVTAAAAGGPTAWL